MLQDMKLPIMKKEIEQQLLRVEPYQALKRWRARFDAKKAAEKAIH